jgi:hypothetical protein
MSHEPHGLIEDLQHSVAKHVGCSACQDYLQPIELQIQELSWRNREAYQ